MSLDCFQMAAEGWQIISRNKDSRQGARYLLRWMAEVLNLSVAEIHYTGPTGKTEWVERVDRFVPGASPGARLERPFPGSSSRWILEGDVGELASDSTLLDLLADQWLRLAEDDNRTENRPRNSGKRHKDHYYPGWTALSRGSRIVRSRLNSLALSSAPLLLIGEEGSGKRHLADILHSNGPDPAAPFTGPGDSHIHGTLFVPGWNRLDRLEQKKLAGDPRRLIASVVPEKSKLDEIRRAWLQIHSSGQTLTVPSLKDRKEDIPALAGLILEETTAARGVRTPEITPAAIAILRTYTWPGNVPELQGAIFRSLEILGESEGCLDGEHLPPEIRGAVLSPGDSSFPEQLVALEYEALKKELTRQRGNMTRTARALGLTPRQVSWRVRKYGIDPRDFKPHLRAE